MIACWPSNGPRESSHTPLGFSKTADVRVDQALDNDTTVWLAMETSHMQNGNGLRTLVPHELN